jgi:hypothetical protein
MSRTRAILSALLLFSGLFIIIIAALQYLFVRHEIRQTVSEQLDNWANDLRITLDRNNKLDLVALRRAAPKASAFLVLASDGTVIATHGFVRGSISYAALPAGTSYDRPVLVTSSLGEEWHLFARKVRGGSVIVGASSTDCPPDINARLLDTAKRFGNSLESAMAPSFRDKDENVDFAVLANDGILWADYGGIPLKARKTPLLFRQDGPIVTVANTPLFIRKIAIIDRARRQIGTIVVIKDVELEEEMLHDSLVFNIAVAAISLFLCSLFFLFDFYKLA